MTTAPSAGLPLAMIRPDLDNLPNHPLPADFSLRWYQSGDEQHWLEIHRQADRFNPIAPSLFTEQFGSDTALLAQRQCYLLHRDACVGTATAWFKHDFQGGSWGRVHWIALLPAYQQRGLGKALLSVVCRRLHQLGHRRACLTTSESRLPAIRLYQQFGFGPCIRSPEEAAAWERLRVQLEGRARCP